MTTGTKQFEPGQLVWVKYRFMLMSDVKGIDDYHHWFAQRYQEWEKYALCMCIEPGWQTSYDGAQIIVFFGGRRVRACYYHPDYSGPPVKALEQ